MYINEKAPLYLVQRIFWGYSSQDLWDVTPLLIKRIRKPLKAFIRNHIKSGTSYPSEDVKSFKEWVAILKKIDSAIDDYYRYEIKDKKCKNVDKVYAEMQEGFRLLGKYLFDLWD